MTDQMPIMGNLDAAQAQRPPGIEPMEVFAEANPSVTRDRLSPAIKLRGLYPNPPETTTRVIRTIACRAQDRICARRPTLPVDPVRRSSQPPFVLPCPVIRPSIIIARLCP